MKNKNLTTFTQHSGVKMTTYLVQNIETFETITTFQSTELFDIWMDTNNEYGIVLSLIHI